MVDCYNLWLSDTVKWESGLLFLIFKNIIERLVCLIRSFTSQSTIFSYVGMGLPGLNKY